MAQTTFSTVQAKLAAALTAIAAESGSPLVGIPVVVDTYQSLVPKKDGPDTSEKKITDALALQGMCFNIRLPGSTPRDAAENAGILQNLSPALLLYINPTALYAATGLQRDPHAVLDHLVPRLVGRPVETDGKGMQRWHVGAVTDPVETALGLMVRINVTAPAQFTRTS